MPQSFEAKIQKNRNFTERLADDITQVAGTFSFFIINTSFFVIWILVNTGQVPNLPVFDPYPFTFLTMVVSLEAIFLAIFVLISQNRQSAIASLREEIHLLVNQIAEREITKTLKLVSEIHQMQFPKAPPDPELEQMLKKLNTKKIEADVERELGPQPLVISELLEKAEERIFKK